MPEISVMGNCHAISIAACISAWLPESDIHCRTLGAFESGTDQANLNYINSLSKCDKVFIQFPFPNGILPSNFDFFEPRVERFPRVDYTAFHPDSTYVTQGKASIIGATGPYNSAITLAGFLEDIQQDRLIKLFNRFTFSSLGYLNQHKTAVDILRHNFGKVGFDPDPVLASGIFMHTMNHPKMVALAEVAIQALRRSGLAPLGAVNLPADPLERDWIWPVYADLPNGEHYTFYRGIGQDSSTPLTERGMPLRKFIEVSYASYADVDFDTELPSIVNRARNFIVNNLK